MSIFWSIDYPAYGVAKTLRALQFHPLRRGERLMAAVASALLLLLISSPSVADDDVYDPPALRSIKAAIDGTARPIVAKTSQGRTPLRTLVFIKQCADLSFQIALADQEGIQLDPSIGASLETCIGPFQEDDLVSLLTDSLTQFWLFDSQKKNVERALFWLLVGKQVTGTLTDVAAQRLKEYQAITGGSTMIERVRKQAEGWIAKQ
jgi:hypothetical protein